VEQCITVLTPALVTDCQHELSKRAAEASAVDRARYGRAFSSPRTFMQHHSHSVSPAAVMGDAAAIYMQEGGLSQAAGLPLLPRLPVPSL
jgi:hypothetical protein